MALREGAYTWNIEEPTLLNKIIHAKNGEEFVSNAFQIAQLKWRINIRPNGMDRKSIGSFDVFLELMKSPSSWKEITICKTINSPQTKSGFTKMVRYIDGKSSGWPAYSLMLKEITQAKLKQIIIKINIKILQIRLKSSKLYYWIKFNYNKKQQLIWKFDAETINKLKLSNKGKISCSNVYNDMWAIQINPNGWHQKHAGKFIVALELCALPLNVNKIKVQRTVLIKQLKYKKTKTSQYSSKDPCKILIAGSFEKFRSCQQFEIVMDVNILRLYDKDGKEINNAASTKYDEYVEKVSNNDNNGNKESELISEKFDDTLNSLQIQELLDINKQNGQQIKSLMNVNKHKEQIETINDKLKQILDEDKKDNGNYDNMMIEINTLKQEIQKMKDKENRQRMNIMKKIKIGFGTVCLVAGIAYIMHHFVGKNKDQK